VINNQINLWEQAQIAQDTANWSLLLQCLQLILEQVGRGAGGQRGAEEKIDIGSPQSRSSLVSQQVKLLEWAIDILIFGDFHQRWDAAKLLPKFGQSAIAPLIELLQDEDADEELQWFIARSLGQFDRADAIAALIEILKTSESEELQAMAAAALSEIGASAVAAISELLVEENTRYLAARSLSYIRLKETIAPLLSVIQDPQVEIRAIAIEALSSFHDPQIPPVLLRALDDIAAPVRREAAIGLGFRPDLREELDLVNCLLPRLYDFNLDVCNAAAIALGRLGTDTAASGLDRVLKSQYTPESLQIEIVRALGRIGTETSLDYLRSALDQLTSQTLQQEIVTVLGRIEQPQLKVKAAEVLIELLKTGKTTQLAAVKQAIALSLGQLGQISALDELIGLLADQNSAVRLHAIAALKQLESTKAYHKLEQMSSNESLEPQLKQGIAIALQEWAIEG
jgi:HEAT repeat protein